MSRGRHRHRAPRIPIAKPLAPHGSTLQRAAALATGEGRQRHVLLTPDGAEALKYVTRVWGFVKVSQAVDISLRHLAKLTREGLPKLDVDPPVAAGITMM